VGNEEQRLGASKLVSIGMTVYSGERFLPEALNTLLAQTYENFELIISDSALTDKTEEICREYAARHARIRFHRNKTNLDAIKDFNRAFELSTGEYFMWAADHDVWELTFISRCVEVLEQDTLVVLYHPLTRWIETDDTRGEVIPPRHDRRGID
jgi:glycosyltransferase involved in cell wall biosynthesis